jgi:hypothetical protein
MVGLLQMRGANPIIVKEHLQETSTTREIYSFPELAHPARSFLALPSEQEVVALTGLLFNPYPANVENRVSSY